MNFASEFRNFLIQQNFLALALAVVIGGAVGKVVPARVDDVVMPLVGLVLPSGTWRTAQWVLRGENAIKYGDLLGRVVDFLIIALVVFLIARALIKQPPPPETKACPFCLEALPMQATRCRACTSQLP
ncbi:MAG: large conductance mechanosensitive channel protein MscL [Myxococcaceae bacterium]|nr:large conductance mechanosensitive channel protein MscL [Myxococcaceae bacterium]